MAVNNTLSVKEYELGTTATTFPITFEFTTDDNGNAENIYWQRAMKNADGQYIESEQLTEGVAGDFTISGGNVNYIDDVTQAGKYLIIYRSTPVSQLTDFIDNGNYSLEDIERALDKLTFIIQERTGTPSGTYINVGVSLFFASMLQLTTKKDMLNYLFASWDDITDEDKPVVAGNIRGQIDAVSRTGNDRVEGHKTFAYSPVLENDPQTVNDATRKSYVDGYFPVATANIGNSQVTTGKLASGAVTTAKIADSNVTTAKIADANVTNAKIANGAITTGKIADGTIAFTKFRTGSKQFSLSYDDEQKESSGGTTLSGGQIPYRCSVKADITINNTGYVISVRTGGQVNTATVYYFY